MEEILRYTPDAKNQLMLEDALDYLLVNRIDGIVICADPELETAPEEYKYLLMLGPDSDELSRILTLPGLTGSILVKNAESINEDYDGFALMFTSSEDYKSVRKK